MSGSVAFVTGKDGMEDYVHEFKMGIVINIKEVISPFVE